MKQLQKCCIYKKISYIKQISKCTNKFCLSAANLPPEGRGSSDGITQVKCNIQLEGKMCPWLLFFLSSKQHTIKTCLCLSGAQTVRSGVFLDMGQDLSWSDKNCHLTD